MPKPYDASLRALIDQFLPDWLALVPRRPIGPVRVIDANLSTVTAEADKVLLVEDPQPWILHLELQSSWDDTLPARVAWYNAMLEYRHDCPVHSLVVLLRREANSSKLTGEWTRQFPGEAPYRTLRYQIVRVWQLEAEALATGGWGLFPLAPLCDDAKPILSDLIERMGKRLVGEVADRNQAGILWTVTEILSGLRYENEIIQLVMQKVMNMIDLEESSTYRARIAKGQAKVLREVVKSLGESLLGPADETSLAVLEKIEDVDTLKAIAQHLLKAASWDELFAN